MDWIRHAQLEGGERGWKQFPQKWPKKENPAFGTKFKGAPSPRVWKPYPGSAGQRNSKPFPFKFYNFQATAVFQNHVMLAVSRGCAKSCSYKPVCESSGYGVTKQICRSCCNSDDCNNWANATFYNAKIFTRKPSADCKQP